MKRLNLSIDDNLFSLIDAKAKERGALPSSLVLGILEEYFLKDDAIDYDQLMSRLFQEAQEQPLNEPFLLAELPSFGELVSRNAARASASTVRARVGKSFNAAVRGDKVKNVKRAKKKDGQPLNRAGVALYIHYEEGEEG